MPVAGPPPQPPQPHLGGLRVGSICTLTTASAEDRRVTLDRQLAALNLTTRYVFGPSLGGPAGALAGWVDMLKACRDYPVLLTEDDVDLAARFDASRVPSLPADETLLSLGSGNCASPDCSTPSWVAPHTRRPYTFGMVAVYVPSRAVAERAIAWVTVPNQSAGRPTPRINGKLFIGGFGVKILCPPLFGWRAGRSGVTRRLIRGRKELRCLASSSPRPSAAPAPRSHGGNVHLVTCESREDAPIAMAECVGAGGDAFLRHRNVCRGAAWPSDGHAASFVKFRAVVAYARALPAADLVVYADADALCNAAGALTARALRDRFDEARGDRAIVFQAEPWCWAPSGGRRSQRGCSPTLLALYGGGEAAAPARRDDWRCPRFLNAGGFAGEARALASLGARVGGGRPRRVAVLSERRPVSADPRDAATGRGRRAHRRRDDARERLFATASTAAPGGGAGGGSVGVACVPCGNVTCRCSTIAEWWRGGDALTVLSRAGEYQRRCGTHGGPLLIHPNGPAKPALVPPLQRRLLEGRAAAAERARLGPARTGSAPELAGTTGLWNDTACGRFEVQRFRSGVSFVTNTEERCGRGEGGRACAGGQWTACTHLKLYGLNTAPVLLRLLAFGVRPRSALEIGCGLGTAADLLARFVPGGARVTCAEPEPMLAEVFGRRPLPQRPTQLAVNLFGADGPSRLCARELETRRFDLVYSLEVAEHIAPSARPGLVRLISAATGRLLVFSAARPDQAGTGHIAASSLTKREWIALFEASGLVLLPALSALASRAAYPDRAYDISPNVFVMRAAAATDVDEAEIASRAGPLLDRALLFPEESRSAGAAAGANWSAADVREVEASGRSLVGRAAIRALKRTISSVRPRVSLYEAAVWPELSVLQKQIALGNLAAAAPRS